jgi:hypothetical protein
MRRAALDSDAETFYAHQRSIGTVWGVLLPSWDELSWDDRVDWENKYAEQMTRDKETDDHDGIL